MKIRYLSLALVGFGMVGCTTVQTHSFGGSSIQNDMGYSGQQRASLENIQILYSDPRRDYETVGTFSVKRYKPAFSDPTVSDALEQLRQSAYELNADAVIIRSTNTPYGQRIIIIEGEAIRWR